MYGKMSSGTKRRLFAAIAGGFFAFTLITHGQEEAEPDPAPPEPPDEPTEPQEPEPPVDPQPPTPPSEPEAPGDPEPPTEPEDLPARPDPVVVPEEDRGELFDRIEWRGMLALPGAVEFSLHDPVEQRGFWVTVEDPRFGIKVEEYDAQENVLTLRFGERTRTLGLAGGGVVGMVEEPTPGVESAEPLLPDAEPDTEQDEPSEPHPEFERVQEAWGEAISQSPRLQEIQQQAVQLQEAAAEAEESLRELEPGDPEREELIEHQAAIRAEMHSLERSAVAEAQNTPALSNEEMEALITTVRSGLYPRPDGPDNTENETEP